MKKLFLVLFVFTSMSLFAESYWSGKKFIYESITTREDSESFSGYMDFIDDKTLTIQIGEDKKNSSTWFYVWDQKMSIMTIGKIGFSFKKNGNKWQITKMDESPFVEKFILTEK